MQFHLHNIEDWAKIVDAIKPQLSHSILLLKGNLGAGKTTFTKFLLESFGSEDSVSSPTYAIVNEYNTPKGKVYHFDLYRLKNVEEVFDIGIEEYLDSAFLSIIEWPEVYEDQLDLPFHEMTIEQTENGRQVNFI